ncbi:MULTISPECIES: YaaR family protein [Brevibacillus]|uniref:YaaR family protein n=1 Tax=Brevibacillus TaxID=55080 RepID=UPI002041054B|nr:MULTISPECIES: YaaR family protein [Brevibacillus]MCM3080158.1 YaaR family protein [Brevibacillus invocatus]MCM3430396.1 YaaR family protein [Brevibacillus invocatus]MDH4619142.1 YaaR family protein [Brevibacillus sp. AY1]
MKIGDGLRPKVEMPRATDSRRNLHTEKLNFGTMVQGEDERMSQERLTQLLSNIDKQGQILARSRSIRDFYAYKNLVKQFMEEAVQYGIALDDRRGMNRRGRSRLYKIVKEVDAELLKLTDELLSEQAPMIDLLARIGEIRGMLINLYF